MDESKYRFALPEGTKEIIVREGEALPLKEPKTVNVKGTIDAPIRYLRSRKEYMDKVIKSSHVIVDKENGFITLIVDEDEHYGSIISGGIVLSKEVKSLDILAKDIYRTPDETADFLKRMKHLFASETEYMDVYKALRSFKAKVDKEIEALKDDNGNYNYKQQQAVDHNIPKSFLLSIPLFRGVPPVTFSIDFIVNSSLLVAIFSNELIQKIDQTRGDLIDSAQKEIEGEFPELLVMNV